MKYRDPNSKKRGASRRNGEFDQPVVAPSFVKYLAAKRRSLNISLTCAARAIGLTPAGLCNKEAGRSPLYKDESILLQELYAATARTGELFE